MPERATEKLGEELRKKDPVSIFAALTIFLALVVIVGWMLDIRVVKSLVPGWPTMKVNTALAFFLCGQSLWLLRNNELKSRAYALVQIFSLATLALAVVTLLQYITGLNLYIDQLLFYDVIENNAPHPGRMAVMSTLCFTLIGISSWLLARNFKKSAVALALPVALASAFVIGFYMVTGYGPLFAGAQVIAFHTALAFLFCSLGLILTVKMTPSFQPILSDTQQAVHEEASANRGFWIALAILVFISIASVRNQAQYTQAIRLQSHTYEVMQEIDNVLFGLFDAQTAQREYVFTGSEQFIRPIEEGVTSSRRSVVRLEKLVLDNPAQMKRLTLIKEKMEDRFKRLWFVVKLRRDEGLEDSIEEIRSWKGRMLMGEIRSLAQEMSAEENRLLSERETAVAIRAHNSMVTQVLGSVLSFAFLFFVFMRLKNELRRTKKISNTIRILNRELVSSNKELESFSYSVSHDLRAPLRAIDGFSRILHEDYGTKLDDEARRLINVVRTNARQMGQLIDDLLAFSRLGRREIERSVVDMAAMVRSIGDELKTGLPQAQLVFGQLPPAKADPSLLKQVWVNLLSNAFKFSRTVSIPKIEVGSTTEDGEQVYFVKDNGAGFDMQFAGKLFGVFQRLHRPEEYEGTGVGLALVQRIVTRHGGRVWAEGQPGAGATFYFSLPIDTKIVEVK